MTTMAPILLVVTPSTRNLMLPAVTNPNLEIQNRLKAPSQE
jgi:hypothetical protein